MIMTHSQGLRISPEEILQEFARSSEFSRLNLGKDVRFELLSSFERKFSSQYVYNIAGGISPKQIYVKIFKNHYGKSEEALRAEISEEFQTYCFWFEKLSGYAHFTTFKPLFLDTNHKAIITEASPGVNLAHFLNSHARLFPREPHWIRLLYYLRKSGELVRVFQSCYEGQETFNLDELWMDVEIRLNRLVKNARANFSEKDKTLVLKFYEEHLPAAQNEDLQCTYIHSDYIPANILVDGDVLVLHDFKGLRTGHFLFDITRFYHQLELFAYKPIFLSRVIHQLQAAFLNGYGFPEGLNNILFKLFFLRHYLTHFVGIANSREPTWKSNLYNHYVLRQHKSKIMKLISSGR